MLVLMAFENDCEVAAIANATGVSYERSASALSWKDLPGSIENPIIGNPLNLYLALIRLGFWKKNVELCDLLEGRAEAGKTIVLLHSPDSPYLVQHWVTWHGKISEDLHLIAWGDSQQFRVFPNERITQYFEKGGPDCAFSVYEANAFHLFFRRIEVFFRRGAKWLMQLLRVN